MGGICGRGTHYTFTDLIKESYGMYNLIEFIFITE